jgi:adenosine deaminase
MSWEAPDTEHLTNDELAALPKVELHVHLEGTIGGARIAELAARAGTPLPRPAARIFDTHDLSELLALLDWIGSLVTTVDIASEIAHDFAMRAHADGTLYAEVIVNPSHWALPLPELLAGVADGFDRAAAEGLADCRILVSFLRRQSAAEAEAIATHLVEHAPCRVVGLSVDGDERASGRTAPRFARAYRIAGEAGFGRTAHAGESSGPEGVRDALDVLEVDRIDHGVRAAEDPRLVARLADEGVTLNVCLTSNCRHLSWSLTEHPIRALLDAGVRCTLNTDDPAPLGCSLVSEYRTAADALGWGLADLAAMVRRAVPAAFCDDTTKATLDAAIDAYLGAVRDSSGQGGG